MEPRVVSSLIGAILFLLLASPPAFNAVRKMGVKDADMSLVVRSIAVGLLTYLSMMSLV